MTTNINFDLTLHRLKERECSYGIADQYCLNCSTQLTSADIEAGACTNCGSAIDCNDESVDEDLQDDGYGDY